MVLRPNVERSAHIRLCVRMECHFYHHKPKTPWAAGYAARGLGLVSGAASIVSAPTASSLAWLRARAVDMPGLPFARQAGTSEQPTVPSESPAPPCSTSADGDSVVDESNTSDAARQAAEVEEGGISVPEIQSGSSLVEEREPLENTLEGSAGQAGPATDCNDRCTDAGQSMQPLLLFHIVKFGILVCWWGYRG